MTKRGVSCRSIVLNYNSSRSKKQQRTDAGAEVELALRDLFAQFPADKFSPSLPRIVLKHQLYSACSRREIVDQEVQAMREAGNIRLFKIGADLDDNFVIIRSDEFHQFAISRSSSLPSHILQKFIELVLHGTTDLSLSAANNTLPFDDTAVTQLIQDGFLTIRDYECYWVACPDLGKFMKLLRPCRLRIMRVLRRNKYREMLHSELALRVQNLSLPLQYMLHDLVGAAVLLAVPTTSGLLYRIVE